MRDAGGRQRKIIIFSEHRDTLNYLQRKIAGVLGKPDAIVTIHGGTHRDERRKRQALFRSDPEVRVLVATDAAGEGVNLQNANLMVNYDLPWNPNRLEQRFGRIHRIGQQEVCHLWNLVAKETREGDVYHRLLKKLETINEALKGRVFDILGEVFEEKSLKDLLLEAIRYGDQPEVRARLTRSIDTAFDNSRIKVLSPDLISCVMRKSSEASSPSSAGSTRLAELRAAGYDVSSWPFIGGFNDGKVLTAAAGNFRPNGLGIYDLGGNVWEWCQDEYEPGSALRVLRGGSWDVGSTYYVESSYRRGRVPDTRDVSIGFRAVVGASSER